MESNWQLSLCQVNEINIWMFTTFGSLRNRQHTVTVIKEAAEDRSWRVRCRERGCIGMLDVGDSVEWA